VIMDDKISSLRLSYCLCLRNVDLTYFRDKSINRLKFCTLKIVICCKTLFLMNLKCPLLFSQIKYWLQQHS